MKVPVLRRSSRSLLGKRSPKSEVTPTIESTESGSTGLEVSFDDHWKVTKAELSFEEQPVVKKPKRTGSMRNLFRLGSFKNSKKKNALNDSLTVNTSTESPSAFEYFPPNEMEWTKIESSTEQQQDSVFDGVESLQQQQQQQQVSSVWDPFGLSDSPSETESDKHVWDHETHRNVPNSSTLWVGTEHGRQSNSAQGEAQDQESFSDDESSACTTNGVIMEYMNVEENSGGGGGGGSLSVDDNASIANDTISTKKTNITGMMSDDDTASMFSLGVDDEDDKPNFKETSIMSTRSTMSNTSASSSRRRRQRQSSSCRSPRQRRIIEQRNQNMFVEVLQDLRLLAEDVTKEESKYKQCLCVHDKQCL